MNTAETTLTLDSLAAQILQSAHTAAQRLNAGDTLLFVEAYDKLCTIDRNAERISTNVRQNAPASVSIKDCTVTGGATAINADRIAEVEKDWNVTGTAIHYADPTPIQPIPAPTGRTRRTKAQIEADNAAAAQAAAPVEGNGSGKTPSTDSPPTTGISSGSASPTEPSAPPEGIDGITLSTLFKTILSSKEEPDKTTFKNAVRAKLELVGIPQISKLTPDHFENFNTFLLSFKA